MRKPGWHYNKSAVDDVWRWAENSGCPCHLAPALMLYGHRYVLFADDDFLPGTRAVENLLECAERVDDRFATIGQVGRRLSLTHREVPCNPANPNQFKLEVAAVYDRRDVRRQPGEMTKVDLTCRSSLVRADTVLNVPMFRYNLLMTTRAGNLKGFSVEEVERLVGVHDDFLKCVAIQLKSNGQLPSYVIPATDDPERNLIARELPNGHESVWRRPGHYAERDRWAQLALACGWRSQATNPQNLPRMTA